MPRLTLKKTTGSDDAPTSTNTNDDNSARATRQDSARPRLILHLNAKQRKEAEAAARSLRRAAATLESYRQSLNGHAATESEVSQPLLDSARAAIRTFESISHPGDRARNIFNPAKRAYEETTRLMSNDIERLLEFQLEAQRAANKSHCGRQ